MGTGQPILFIHGLWMSSRFFHHQLPYFARNYRAVAIDLRGHGRSAPIAAGHTVGNYARDIRMFIDRLQLKQVVMVGSSMGCFVIWDYFRQFGDEELRAIVNVDQSASDFNTSNWQLGVSDFESLCRAMVSVQENREAFVRDLLPLMFCEAPAEEETAWMFAEMTRLSESIAGAILFDQTVQDYRPILPKINIPTLLCFGADEKLYKMAAGEYLRDNLPSSKLVSFEKSGHCPFLEEPDRFNEAVRVFIESLG